VHKEWTAFREERAAGIEEIKMLRQKVVEEEARKKAERELAKESAAAAAAEPDAEMEADVVVEDAVIERTQDEREPEQDVEMDVDGVGGRNTKDGKDIIAEADQKEDTVPMQGDEDDAVEY
jgi:hypothetical protein